MKNLLLTTHKEYGLVFPPRSQIVFRVDDVSDMDTQISCVWGYELLDQ